MDQKIREMLSKPIKEYKKPGAGGRQFSYIKGEDVIGRLNTAFGHGWSSKVVNSWVTEDKIKQVIVLVEITAEGITHQGYGGAEIAVYTNGNRQGEPVDVSNSWKSALTNSIKNAAKHFGIGLLTDETDTDFSDIVPTVQPVKPAVKAPPKPTVPVSGSANISTHSEEKKNDQISKILAAADKITESNKNQTLAQGFKDNQNKPTTEPSPFKPSTGETDKVNDVQIGAMTAMSKLKDIKPEDAIKAATGLDNKKEFKDLSSDEARKVIKHLHVAAKGA